MRKLILAGLLLALPSAAFCQNLGEDRAWQFKTPDQTAVQANIQQLIELKKSGYYDAIKNGGSFGSLGGGGFGGLGSAANTSNIFQFIDNSVTTNNCSSTGTVGAPITCGGGGGNTVSGTTQNSTGNTQNASNQITGNTLSSSSTTNTGPRGN